MSIYKVGLNSEMEVISILSIVLIIFGVYLFLKDFKYMLQGIILMILGAGILGLSLH